MSKSRPVSEPLEKLPAQTVRRLGGLDIEELRIWAQRAQHCFVLIECAAFADKKALLKAIGQALAFPEWFGANLDALYDCLTDLTERNEKGWLIVLEHLPNEPRFDAEQRVALLEVFRDAVDEFAVRGTPFRVFYS